MSEATPWAAPVAPLPPARLEWLTRALLFQQVTWHLGNLVVTGVVLLVWWSQVWATQPDVAPPEAVLIGMSVAYLGWGAVGVPLSALWQVRAAQRLVRCGGTLRLPVWLHGAAWFVPVAQLVLPLMAQRELLEGCGRSAARVPLWGALFWGGVVCRMALPDDLGAYYRVATVLLGLSALMLAASAGLYVQMVVGVAGALEGRSGTSQ